MARDRDDEKEELKRRREREDEREREEALSAQKKGLKSGTGANSSALQNMPGVDPAILFETQLAEAQGLIEKTHSLYAQYFAGLERTPPREARARLERLVETLQKAQKPTAAYNFRFNAMKATYISYRDRWDKLTKDFDNGKIRPIAGPKLNPRLKKSGSY